MHAQAAGARAPAARGARRRGRRCAVVGSPRARQPRLVREPRCLVVDGGRTMNPSTAESSLRSRLRAPRVLVLPNNRNVLMAADQAAAPRRRPVLPTRSIQAGLMALVAFAPAVDRRMRKRCRRRPGDAVRRGHGRGARLAARRRRGGGGAWLGLVEGGPSWAVASPTSAHAVAGAAARAAARPADAALGEGRRRSTGSSRTPSLTPPSTSSSTTAGSRTMRFCSPPSGSRTGPASVAAPPPLRKSALFWLRAGSTASCSTRGTAHAPPGISTRSRTSLPQPAPTSMPVIRGAGRSPCARGRSAAAGSARAPRRRFHLAVRVRAFRGQAHAR